MQHDIVSYGGGTQTRAMLYWILEGRIKRPHLIVFADTQREPPIA